MTSRRSTGPSGVRYPTRRSRPRPARDCLSRPPGARSIRMLAEGLRPRSAHVAVRERFTGSVVPLRRQTAPPISRSPFVVRYGDHFDTALDLSIDDAIGKLAENVPPRPCLEIRPDGRCTRDQSKRARRLANKRLRRLGAPFKIPLKCVIDLPKSFRGKLNPGGAHSASPESRLGSLPMESSPPPRPPAPLPEPLPLGAKLPRHRLLAQAPSSPTRH